MQKGEEIGDNIFDVVGDEDVVGIQMNLIPAQFHFFLQLREVQNACQIEWEVHVQMNMEKRVFEIHRIQVPIKFLIIFILKVGRCFAPQG